MSAARHTPGPWRTSVSYVAGQAARVIEVVGYDGTTIARWIEHDNPKLPTTENSYDENADLIAAAPELLEAAEMVLCMLPSYGIHSERGIPELRAAIAKARGGK